ncbi:MAG: hypothetical protein FWD53_12080 [Phycisphaerales bacterium]|nr:hypothetical protein [Phycisphaerales bacterium]
MMFHAMRAILLNFIMVIATLLCGCQTAISPPLPVTVPLTATAIPDGTIYIPSSIALGDKNPKRFLLTEQNPTAKLTLGGLECVVTAEVPPHKRDQPYQAYGEVPGTKWTASENMLLKTPTQEFTFEQRYPPSNLMELTLDNGRKYFLWGQGFTFRRGNVRTKEVSVQRICTFWSAGVQTGKLPSPFQTPIAIFDSNLDGFYTTGEDGIVVGSLTGFVDCYSMLIATYRPRLAFLVQPLSKYISAPTPAGGIFEIQNLAKDGSELTVLPYTGPTARLEVIAPPSFSGQIVMTSDAGLNVTVNGKAGESVTVVPGGYTILAALLTNAPPEQDPQPSLMRVSGTGMPPLKVEAGTKQTLVLSGPKTFEFQAALVDGKVNIDAKPLSYFKGQAGETYSDVSYDDKNPPKVYLNVDGKSMLLGNMEFG